MQFQRIIPRTINVGMMRSQMGRYVFAPPSLGQKKIPLRMLQYHFEGREQIYSWQQLCSQKDGARGVEIKSELLGMFLYPPFQGIAAGALLLSGGEKPEGIKDPFKFAGEQFKNDFARYCKWVVLLPSLQEEAYFKPGFEISMIGVSARGMQKETKKLVSDLLPDIREKLASDINGVIFLYPFYPEQRFSYGSDPRWVPRISYFLGRIISRVLIEGADVDHSILSYDADEYFALVYQQRIISSLVRNLSKGDFISGETFSCLREFKAQNKEIRREVNRLNLLLEEEEKEILRGLFARYKKISGYSL